MRKFFLILFYTIFLSSGIFGQSEQTPDFSWDNASVYFVMTDRFQNGNPLNDHSYGRGFDGNGAPYEFDEVGSFYGGDIKGLTDKIEEGYFDDLGINALWITAPYEQIHGWVSGKDGSFQHYAYHGYYTLDWTEMDANMGTRNEFQEFVDAAHAHGIRVIMDIVMNHTGYNTADDMANYDFGCIDDAWKGWRPSNGQTWEGIHDYIDYDCNAWTNWWSGNWVRAGLPGYPQPGGDEKTMSLAGLPDVITESTATVSLPPVLNTKWSAEKKQQELAELDVFFARTGYPRTPRNYLVKWLTDWVREFGIDGFRVDTEKHVEGEAWKVLKAEAVLALREWKTNNPDKKPDDLDFWMTAENFGYGYGRSDYHINNGFNSVINFSFQGQAGNMSQLESLFSSYAQTINTDPEWNVLSYISSHDTKLYDRNNLMNAGTSLLLLPGGIQIYYGDETARPFGPTATDPHQGTRSYMNWNSINQELLFHWQKLGQFRRDHLSVGAGSHQKISDNPYSFKREYQNDKVIVAIGANGSTTLQVGSAFADGTEVRDTYTGNIAVVAGGQVSFDAHQNGIILIEASEPFSGPSVSIDPVSGHSFEPIEVTITATAEYEPVSIYYTLDGTMPNQNSSAYAGPFILDEDATVKAIAIDAEGQTSTIKTAQYTIGELPDIVVHFKKPVNWGSDIRIHHYNAAPEGALEDTSWPGTPMTSEGNSWYSYSLPGITSSDLLFHDNGGNQTPDLSRSRDGWYMNGIWYDQNPEEAVNEPPIVTVDPEGPFTSMTSFTVNVSAIDDEGIAPVIYYTTNGSIPSENSESAVGSFSLEVKENLTLRLFATDDKGAASNIQTHEYTVGEAPVENLVVYFKKPLHWASSIRIHYWNAQPQGSVASTNWPGVDMANEGNGWYSYTFPETVIASNLLFHDNQGRQTADLNRDKDGWYKDNQWYDGNPEENGQDITIHFKTDWSTPTMHFWNVQPSGVAENTTWPGVPMQSEGNGWWFYTIENAECINIVFSNNGYPQTADLYRCGEGWYINGTWYDSQPNSSLSNKNSVMDYSLSKVAEKGLMLEQNYPNPVIGSSSITFSLPKTAYVDLKLYSIWGKEVAVLVRGRFDAGEHTVQFEKGKLPAGIYRYILSSEDKILYKRLVISE